jgi:hypothetical protein
MINSLKFARGKRDKYIQTHLRDLFWIPKVGFSILFKPAMVLFTILSQQLFVKGLLPMDQYSFGMNKSIRSAMSNILSSILLHSPTPLNKRLPATKSGAISLMW